MKRTIFMRLSSILPLLTTSQTEPQSSQINRIRILLVGVLAATGIAAAAEPEKAPTRFAITRVQQTPFLVPLGGKLRSETVLTIANPGPARHAWVRITVAEKRGGVENLGELAVANNLKTVHVPELSMEKETVTFEVFDREDCAGQPLAATTVPQHKVRHWTIYVNHDMHQDIGYTRYQEDLKRPTWPGYLDVVLKAMSDSDGWDDASKARLGMESSFTMYDGALTARNADWIETIKKRVAERRLDWGSGYGDIAQENMSAEELARSCYYSRRHLPDLLGGGCSSVVNMADNNSLCWSVVDTFREAGIKYYTLQLWGCENRPAPLPYLSYVESSRSGRRLLVGNTGDYTKEPFSLKGKDPQGVRDAVEKTLLRLQTSNYPYDAVLCQFSNSDNGRIDPQVYERIRNFNAMGYAYPKMICALPEDFYRHIEGSFAEVVPVVKGNFENWWNYGMGAAAYETAAHKESQDPLAAGEFLATMATVLGASGRYPYENLADAWRNMALYCEHTFGSPDGSLNNQWYWKRNTALAARTLADKVMRESLAAVSSRIPTAGPTIVVYNFLPWNRNDLTRIPLAKLPKHFDLIDNQTGKPAAYELVGENEAVFVATDVPGLGYKTFRVTARTDDPKFSGGVTVAGNVLENRFFKIFFDGTGAIASIRDKMRGDAELVDKAAPFRMNEFVYSRNKDDHRVESAKLSAVVGPLMATMTADGACQGVESLKRSVVLYDAIPRIDFVQDVVKSPSGFGMSAESSGKNWPREEGYFVFPLNVPKFLLRHEMPTGNVRPVVDPNPGTPEQIPGTCADHFTVNRWIDVSNQSDFGVTLSPVDVPLVMYGKRTARNFNVSYKAANPWIYSYAFNNLWWANWQKTQPGRVVFRYSLRPHGGADWLAGGAHRFGAEVCSPLRTCVIPGRQDGVAGLKTTNGQFLKLDQPNVVLTTAKLAEANGQGIILRFNEIEGRKTEVSVDLGLLAPAAVMQTDLVENDRGPLTVNQGVVTFSIDGFSWATLRVMGGRMPPVVAGISAVTAAKGTQVTWTDQQDASQFEVFRGASPDFEAGAGNYLATASNNHFYDRQVDKGVNGRYFYRVRAVRAGSKGPLSTAAQAAVGELVDTMPPSAPRVSAQALRYDKITLSWEPSTDNVAIKAYEVYRDNKKIADVEPFYLSWYDFDTVAGQEYSYTVKAVDEAGNRSEASRESRVGTQGFTVPDPARPSCPGTNKK
ncbi:MAG: glycosyl hydrolase-related protein [Thermoguttaceae bacterium]